MRYRQLLDGVNMRDWNVRLKGIVRRVETVDYNITAATGDEARAKVVKMFEQNTQSNEKLGIMGVELIDFDSVREA